MRVRDLYWDDDNVNHLWDSHEVTTDEVGDILLGIPGEDPFYTVRRDGDYYVFAGRSGNGRLLKMAGEDLGDGVVRIFHAIDMSPSQARRFREIEP